MTASLLQQQARRRPLSAARSAPSATPLHGCGCSAAPAAVNQPGQHRPDAHPAPGPTTSRPPGLLYAGSLWLSNSAYLYLSVSFIQMTKSLMPGLVYGCGCFVGTERFRGNVALNMALIAFGVVVCAVGEVNLVFRGLVQQLVALGF